MADPHTEGRRLAEILYRAEEAASYTGAEQTAQDDVLYLLADLAAALAEAEQLREALASIQAFVDEQAEDGALWTIHRIGEQPIAEAYLQQELRRLHDVIERAFASAEVPATTQQDSSETRLAVPDIVPLINPADPFGDPLMVEAEVPATTGYVDLTGIEEDMTFTTRQEGTSEGLREALARWLFDRIVNQERGNNHAWDDATPEQRQNWLTDADRALASASTGETTPCICYPGHHDMPGGREPACPAP